MGSNLRRGHRTYTCRYLVNGTRVRSGAQLPAMPRSVCWAFVVDLATSGQKVQTANGVP